MYISDIPPTKVMLEFYIRAIVSNPKDSNTALVYLLNDEKKILLPIEMGIYAADRVMDAQNRTLNIRPTTCETAVKVIKALGGKISEVIIYKYQFGIFYSYIRIKMKDKYLEIDARPSDAMPLALLENKPIYVLPKVYKKLGISITKELVSKWSQRRYS